MYVYISKYMFMYILKAYIKTTWCWHPLPLHTWSAPREANPTFRTTPPGLQFLRKLGPNFQNTGLEIEPRFPAKPLRRKSVPNLDRSWGESSLQPFGCKLVRLQLGQIQVASTAIHLHLLHGHRPRSRPDQIQNPKSKRAVGFWILDFGFWILDFGFWTSDFGFWILDFGFWILDFGFSLRSFCGGPKRPRLDFGFRILDFGLGLGSVGAVWILHKIFPSHADSGRRIFIYLQLLLCVFSHLPGVSCRRWWVSQSLQRCDLALEAGESERWTMITKLGDVHPSITNSPKFVFNWNSKYFI